MSEVKELVIDRSRWLVTAAHMDKTRQGFGVLYDSKTKRMCCLGFLARKCAAKVKDICDVGMPYQTDIEAWPAAANMEWCELAAKVNDSSHPTRAKESVLKEHFAKIGIKLTFKGKL